MPIYAGRGLVARPAVWYWGKAMVYLVFIFGAVTLFVGAGALLDGGALEALAIVAASCLAFVAGSGLRGSLYSGNPKVPATSLAVVICGASLALMHFLDLMVGPIDGKLWSATGALIGFLAAKKEHALTRPASKNGNRHGEEVPKTLEDYRQALGQLGEIMEEHPGVAFPADRLPLPKEEMKTALKQVWLVTEDDYFRRAIESGYSHLAFFHQDLKRPLPLTPDPNGDGFDMEWVKDILSEPQFQLFQTMNEEAIALAEEFTVFKASQN